MIKQVIRTKSTMIVLLNTILLLILQTNTMKLHQESISIVGNPLAHAYLCGYDNIVLSFEPNLPPETENRYHISIFDVELPANSKIYLKFDSEASVTLSNKNEARITTSNDSFFINFFKKASGIGLDVKGPIGGPVPYLIGLKINGVEYCQNYTTGYLDSQIKGYADTAEIQLSVPDEKCGRRKIQHSELITNGLRTNPGDWPWHVAIYRLEKANNRYICGGTLLSKNFVLTAAHCATISGSPVLPEILSVVLGKYNLIGDDIAKQERQVHEVIVHEDFTSNNLDNDIAMLKLKSEVQLVDYIQPACLWYKDVQKKLPPGQVFGTVVGWGFDHTDQLSSELRQATMPKVSDSTCIKTNPLFYGKLLNDRKFCAGWLNGTSACNGDSGGGFMVFAPDSLDTKSLNPPGAWYLRGIVSTSLRRQDVALCDPNQYVVFTDVAKFRGWIKKYIKDV